MRNEKILVVEFEENTLNSLYQFLQTAGFKVITAKDGHEGLIKFESENPDLVILEPMLLKLHGFDLCRKISEYSNQKTPVIITTGFYKGEHYRSEAIQSFGASAFFEKPYENEKLLSAIKDLLANGTKQAVREGEESTEEEAGVTAEFGKEVAGKQEMAQENKTGSPKRNLKVEPDPGYAGQSQKKREIEQEVDELLKDTLSEFGLGRGESKAASHQVTKPQKKSEKSTDKEEEADRDMLMAGVEHLKQEPRQKEEAVHKSGDESEDRELKTENLIEEMIQKEEKSEEEEEEKGKPIEKDILTQEDIKEADEEKEEVREGADQLTRKPDSDKAIFKDYFERPEKAFFYQAFLDVFKRIKKPLPVIIASTVFVVLVAAGATWYFLNSGQKSAPPSSQKAAQVLSDVQKTPSNPQQMEGSLPNTAVPESTSQENPQGTEDPLGSESGIASTPPSAVQGVDAYAQQASVSELTETTWLSSERRQFLLPSSAPTPKTTEFEVIEVQETQDGNVEQGEVNIDSAPLKDTAKKIIQPDNVSERIKTGDLVPIESVDVAPVTIKKTTPKYPPVVFEAGIEAKVVVKALISEFGNVLDVTFAGSKAAPAAFTKSCERAIRKWKFEPAKKDGVNVKVWKTFTFIFKKKNME